MNPFQPIIAWITDFFKRRRHFTYEEWKGLIDKSDEKNAKLIESPSMKVVFEYKKEEQKQDVSSSL